MHCTLHNSKFGFKQANYRVEEFLTRELSKKRPSADKVANAVYKSRLFCDFYYFVIYGTSYYQPSFQLLELDYAASYSTEKEWVSYKDYMLARREFLKDLEIDEIISEIYLLVYQICENYLHFKNKKDKEDSKLTGYLRAMFPVLWIKRVRTDYRARKRFKLNPSMVLEKSYEQNFAINNNFDYISILLNNKFSFEEKELINKIIMSIQKKDLSEKNKKILKEKLYELQ